jgi:multisubunit Na+/H+ antiporter MnhF subunit
MTTSRICAQLVLLGGFAPALLLACCGDAVARLVGAQLCASVLLAFLLLFAQLGGESTYLSLPLVLVPVSVAGTLVYTRSLAPHPGSDRP